MKTVLAYSSALEFWRSSLSDAGLPRARCRACSLPEHMPSIPRTGVDALFDNGILSKPIHVLTLDGRRNRATDLAVHQMYVLPAQSLRATPFQSGGEAVFVTSPELTFVHMASLLSFPRLVHLGYELCGTYAPDETRPYGVRSRPPLTTPEKLEAYLDKTERVRGAKRARVAIRHVLNGSASPRESILAELLTLPYTSGGSGVAPPRMNASVPLGRRNSWSTDKSFFRCDLLWPEKKVAVEYDSTLCHTGAERIAEDAARRNALESLGLTVVTATWRQVENYREYNRFARILAEHLATRMRPRCCDYPSRQLSLRSELLR